MSMKNSNDTIGNQTRDLPACSAVPQPTAPLRAPSAVYGIWIIADSPCSLEGNEVNMNRSQGFLFALLLPVFVHFYAALEMGT
jgi:hypothetical protein